MSMCLPCARCWLVGGWHRPPSLRLGVLSGRPVSGVGHVPQRHVCRGCILWRQGDPCRCKAEGSLPCIICTMWSMCRDLLVCPVTLLMLREVMPPDDPMHRSAAARHVFACQCRLAGRLAELE